MYISGLFFFYLHKYKGSSVHTKAIVIRIGRVYMKSENLIYLLAFLFGVTTVSIFRVEAGGDSSTLNRYTLAGLSFHGIIYEEFFLQNLSCHAELVSE